GLASSARGVRSLGSLSHRPRDAQALGLDERERRRRRRETERARRRFALIHLPLIATILAPVFASDPVAAKAGVAAPSAAEAFAKAIDCAADCKSWTVNSQALAGGG